VSIIKPFRALRPVPEKAKMTACVPYDVVYDDEVREFIRENPLNFLRVTRPEAEFPENANPSSEEIFAKAKENLQKFIDGEIFAYEAEPCLYVYRLETNEHSQTGVVACCSLDEYELGLIKKHEKTRPDKVEDRTAHMISVRAQTGLIFLAFRNTDKIRTIIYEIKQTSPVYDFTCARGVRQTVWRISLTESLTEAFAEVPAIYIADGHHRAESANLARKKLAAENPEHSGAEDYNFVVAGIFPSEDLRILAYNRVVKDLNGLTEAEFLEKLNEKFAVAETDEKEPKGRGEFCMYLSGTWYRLRFANADFLSRADAIEKLDVSILQNYLLSPILGIGDPRTDERIAFVGGARGVKELEKMVDENAARVAFSLFPTTMEDLFAVSDMNEIMPPKSTWFEPKLKDGLLVHLI
jgi:uncharacterized protein (DUF1015 family)